jgi:multiple sugar transport system substrate-binding protein
MKRRLLMTAAGTAVAALALTACTNDGGNGSAEETTDAAAAGDADAPAELDFWTWATGIEDVVAIWNEANPDQQVTVDRQAQGDELITRTLTAAQAGNEPCIVHTEYQALPVLVSNGVVRDITADVEDITDAFPEGAWQLTSFGDQTFAVPQDIAPMMLFYREDLFQQYGLEVPTTWEQFADVAAQVREVAQPGQYLTTFSSGDPGWFAGLSQQAGAQWWTSEGEAWRVGITDDETTQVAEFWGDLVAQDLVDDQPMYTPEWNAAMNDGTLLAWPTAVWGAGVLEGIAPDTAGKWRAVPMPQWSEGEQTTGYWGGSGTAITEGCEYPAQAAKFVKWLNTSPESLEAMVEIGGLYPAATAGQTQPAMAEPPTMLPNQPEFFEQASEIAETAQGFTWGPNVNVVYSSYNDAFQQAVETKGSFTDALETMQEAAVSDLETQGFEVAE